TPTVKYPARVRTHREFADPNQPPDCPPRLRPPVMEKPPLASVPVVFVPHPRVLAQRSRLAAECSALSTGWIAPQPRFVIRPEVASVPVPKKPWCSPVARYVRNHVLAWMATRNGGCRVIDAICAEFFPQRTLSRTIFFNSPSMGT